MPRFHSTYLDPHTKDYVLKSTCSIEIAIEIEIEIEIAIAIAIPIKAPTYPASQKRPSCPSTI